MGLALTSASAALAQAPATTVPVTTVYASATTGRLAAVHPAPSVPAATPSPRSSSLSHGARRFPHRPSVAAPAVRPPLAGAPGLSGGQGSLPANFNGVSSRDSELTNFGAEFEPPDQGLCVGNGYVVEMVNSAYTVYRRNGTVVTGPYNVNGPFDEGLTEFTSDPRCHYDAATHTWFATVLYINAANTGSRVDLAVNTSGDPTKPWTTYRIDTAGMGGQTGTHHPGCPCFGDQPTLGIDASNVYVTTNEFSILGPQFYGAQIYAISKSDLVSGLSGPSVHLVHFDNLSVGGMVASSVQPALTDSTAPAEFFLSSLDPHMTFDQRIGVWAMTNRSAVTAGGRPTLSSVVMGSEAYGVPPAAEQKGTGSTLDSGDDRMQQVQYIGGEVWGALDSAVTIPGDPAIRAGAAWFDVRPTLQGGVITAAQPRRQGYVVQPGAYFLYPAIQATAGGQAVIVGTLTGQRYFPSAAYSVLSKGASEFGNVRIAAAGTTHYDPSGTRWGDYSWAVLDPSGRSVWGATEYMPPKASQTTDGARNWGTRVFDVATG